MAWTDTPAEEAERDLRRELHQAQKRIAELEAEVERLRHAIRRARWLLKPGWMFGAKKLLDEALAPPNTNPQEADK